MAEGARMPSLGVLNFKQGGQKFQLTRHAPSKDIGFFVKHYWVVKWDLRGQSPYVQSIVPNPCVNLVIQKGRTAFYGPSRQVSSYRLQGKGRVFGVKFKPGGFFPFYPHAVSEWQEKPLKISQVLAVDEQTLEEEVLSQADESAMIQCVESYLRRELPEEDGNVMFIDGLVQRIWEDREMTKVDQICQSFHINKRKLQRLFYQYVGVSPKWVIKLHRLQNAAEELENGRSCDLLKLSLELGYYDQAHFIKDFKAMIGKTPEEFAASGN